MKYALGVVLAILLPIFSPEAALACRCARVEASADLSPYAAVFSSKVVEAKRLPHSSRVKFKVDSAWKGEAAKEITLFLPRSSDSRAFSTCDIGFKNGESYLVYAFASRTDATLTIGKCSRTAKLADAGDDLALLGEGRTASRSSPLFRKTIRSNTRNHE